MKKALTILTLILMVLIEACRQESEEPVPEIPTITSAELLFVENVINNMDGFRLTLEFSDGDFDFGLGPLEDDPPYHALDFLVSQNNNQQRISSTAELLNPQFSDHFYFIQPSASQAGMFVTFEQLRKQNNSLEFSCKDFTTLYDNVGVKISDKAFIFNTSRIVDTISSPYGQVLIMKDSFLVERNRNHHNLYVDYLLEQTDGTYQVFDFQKIFCQWNFNARVPEILGLNGPSGPFEVKTLSNQKVRLSYNMGNTGFRSLFGGKRVKMRVSIIDRSLNESAVMETQPVLVPKP